MMRAASLVSSPSPGVSETSASSGEGHCRLHPCTDGSSGGIGGAHRAEYPTALAQGTTAQMLTDLHTPLRGLNNPPGAEAQVILSEIRLPYISSPHPPSHVKAPG